MPLKNIRAAKCGLMAGLALSLTGGESIAAPDAIYVNGKVVTVDGHFSIAQAFAVADGKFLAVGRNDEIRKLAGPNTRTVDLGGREVLPGLIDAHPHTVIGHAEQEEMYRTSLRGARSVAEIVSRIGEAARKAPPGQWIVTTGIGEPPDYFGLPEGLAEKRWPTRADLDQVSPDNPVYIPIRKWPHPAIFNGKALALLGITRATPDEPKVIIEHDASGEPNGLIQGINIYNADSPLYQKVAAMTPSSPRELRPQIIQAAIADDSKSGLTALNEMHGSTAETVRSLKALEADGALKSRFAVAYQVPTKGSIDDIDKWMAGLTDAQGKGSGSDMLKVVGVNVTVDGATEFGAALNDKPYLDPYGRMGNGIQEVSAEKLTAIARLAIKHNLRLNILAAGSRACQIAVDAMEAVNRETPIKDRRWVMSHFQHPTREQIKKLHDMGVMVQTYSSVDFSKGAETYVKRFPGQDVWKTVVPLRWYWDEGVTVAQSTDGAHYDTMWTIWESLVRVDGRTGKSMMTPAKKITREEAIKMYTINSAKVMEWEDKIGSIEAGKLADFAVLDRDILTVPVNQIRDARVLMTALGGKAVYGAIP